MTQNSNNKSSKLPLLLIFFTVFIDLVGFGIIIPLMPGFAEKFGANGFTVGLLLMSYSLMQFFFTPVWGRLSDKVGRRPMLLLSLTASAAGYILWGMAGSLTMLFVSRIVAGIGNANLAVAQAYIADITTAENRAKGMGIVGAAFGLGFVLGPAIGALCAQLQPGYSLAGYVAAGFSLLDLVLTFFCLPEPSKRSQAGHERFALSGKFYFTTLLSEKLRLPFAIFFLSTFAFANMEATLVLLTEHQFAFSPAQNGLLFTFIGLLMVFVQGGMIGRLSKRFGEARLMTAGTAIIALGLLLTPATRIVGILYLAVALLAIGSGINNPSSQSIISQNAPADEVGGVMGVGQSVSTLGRILGPVVGGFAFQYLGMSSPYMIGGLLMLVACALSLMLPRQQLVQAKTIEPQAEPTSAGR